MKKKNSERFYFDVLKLIASYQTPEKLKRNSQRQYGLDPDEAMEMAYENVINTARNATRGKRRPAA